MDEAEEVEEKVEVEVTAAVEVMEGAEEMEAVEVMAEVEEEGEEATKIEEEEEEAGEVVMKGVVEGVLHLEAEAVVVEVQAGVGAVVLAVAEGGHHTKQLSIL